MGFLLNPYLGAAGGGGGSLASVGTLAGIIDGDDVLDGETVSLASLSLSQDDLVIVTTHEAGNPASHITLSTSGYTLLTQKTSSDARLGKTRIYYKFMGATPDSDITLGAKSTADNGATYLVQAFSGVDTSQPIGGVFYATGGDAAKPNAPAVTPYADGSAILVIGTAAQSSGGETDFTNPSSQLSDFVEERDVDNSAHSTVAAGWIAWETADGEVDPLEFGGGNAGSFSSWSAWSIILNPSGFTAPTGLQLVGTQTFELDLVSNDTLDITQLEDGIDHLPREDDYVVIGCHRRSGGLTSFAGPTMVSSGWTNLANLFANDTRESHLMVERKIMGVTPDTSIEINQQNTYAVAVVHVFRNVDTTTPEDVTSTTATGANTGRPDPPSITPTTSGAWVHTIGGAAMGGGGDSILANSTDPLLGFKAERHASQGENSIAGGYLEWTSGALDPAGYLGGNTNGWSAWTAISIALRPA